MGHAAEEGTCAALADGALSDADLEAVAGGAMCMEVAWLGFVAFSGLHAAAKSASW